MAIRLIRSIPQTTKGHGEVIDVSFSRCDLGMLENLGNARESLAFVAFPLEAHGVSLHRWPEVSLP